MIKRRWFEIFTVLSLAAFVGLVAFLAEQDDLSAAPPGGGRLSPASLDFDTCGCPSWFGEPTCEQRTHWSITKTTESGPFEDPENEPYSFTVTVTEGETEQTLTGEATLIITNSGEQTTYLSSVVVGLEKVATIVKGDALGPSGKNWIVLAYAIENESALCVDMAHTEYGDATATPGASVLLYDEEGNDVIALSSQLPIPPTLDNDGDGKRDEDPVYTGLNDTALACSIIDNDGDGLFDEDPIDFDSEGNPIDNDGDGLYNEDDPDDDGDGLVDEDGACEDAVVFVVRYEFDIAGLGIDGPGDGIVPSDDDLRINLMGTFVAGGKRGGAGPVDANCNGVIDTAPSDCDPSIDFCYDERWVRTVQQRLRFDPVPCNPVCDAVNLTDGGVTVNPEEGCVVVTGGEGVSDTIWATGVPGTSHDYFVSGTVDCDYYCTPYPDFTGFQGFLDEQEGLDGIVNMQVQYPYAGGPAYFQTTLTNAGELNGVYNGWCVDTNHTIAQSLYCARLVSSYDLSTIAGILNPDGTPSIAHPENFDIVNWIMNQNYVYSPCYDNLPPDANGNGYGEYLGDYTYGDVQRAIWHFIASAQSSSGLGSWSQLRVDEIIAEANAAGDGFVPACGDQVAVILQPVNCTNPGGTYQQVTIAQVTVVDVPGICEDCPPCEATVTNVAELECADGAEGLVEGSPAGASFDVICFPDENPPMKFCSQTQGGWGTDNCNGNNTACLREAYFDELFPNGLVVGDPDGIDGDGSAAILLTSSDAVADLLPTGGPSGILTADLTDPQTTSAGVFAGQLVAATLNVAYDAAGYGKCTLTGDCDFTYPPGTLGTLVYVEGCVADGLAGWSVNEVIAAANVAISGGGTPTGVSISDLSDALATLNENFVDCDTNIGCLALPMP